MENITLDTLLGCQQEQEPHYNQSTKTPSKDNQLHETAEG